MTLGRDKFAPACRLLVVLATLCASGYARPQALQGGDAPAAQSSAADEKDSGNDTKMKQTDDSYESVIDNKNSIGVTFLKNLVIDQKAIWTSPGNLRFGDANWLVPVAAIKAG